MAKEYGKRLRLSPKEENMVVSYRSAANKQYRVLICSDIHGVLVDSPSFNCLLEVLRDNKFDEVVLNGDVIDLPYLSKHDKRLIEEGDLKNYSEVSEIEFAKKNILRPLREATNARIVYRLGNHEERITSPKILSTTQLGRLAILTHHYNSVKLDEMLELEKIGIEYDPNPIRKYFGGIFNLVHGLSLAQGAPKKNIYMYMSSGSSGHSHRLNSTYLTNFDNPYVWVESGCLRKTKEVEYLPTAIVPDWQNGFADVTFDLSRGDDNVRFFAKTYPIINGATEYNGKIYTDCSSPLRLAA